MGLFFLTFGLIAIVMLAMAVGVLFNRPCLRGSCGGPEVVGSDGNGTLVRHLPQPPPSPRQLSLHR